MRTIIIILLTGFYSLGASAQQVSGTIKDADGKPLSGATITLLKDSAVIKLSVTNAAGAYTFAAVKQGTYRIKSSFVGYANAFSAPFTVAADNVKVTDIVLSKAGTQLNTVAVTSQKPVIEVKADKMILNVEGSINAVGSDALELLRKSPGVQVDKDDNLSMSGKNGVQVYIDGRPTPLSGSDLANYLKSLQSSNIEAIELITNPSAKYDASGNAGIINIRLKKNKSFGTNGSVNAGWNQGITPKYNAGISLNYRNKKINIFGNYSYNKSSNEATLILDRTVLDTNFSQNGVINFDNQSHNFKAGADYFIDKKNTLGVIVNGTFANPNISNYGRTPITYVPTNKVDRILIADNTTSLTRHNVNLNLNYSYINPDGRNLTVNADHGNYDLNSDQHQPNYYYNPSGNILLSKEIYHIVAPTTINISSLKADWEQNYAKGKLGFGGKTAFIKTNNDFQFYNVISTGDQRDTGRSNTFAYKENINAGYLNYNRQFKGIMIQAGVRVENTVTKGESIGLVKNASSVYTKYDSSFNRNYTDVFPSAAITFNKNPKSQLNFTYSRRIDRPAYQDLNPFEFRLDAYTYMKGNINLRPQYTNSFGVTHTYKYTLNTTLNYSHIKDLFVQLPDVDGSKGILSKKNLATQDIFSLNISYPFQYKTYSLFTNINTNYSMYKANLGPGRIIDLNAFGASLYMQNTLKFAKTWTAEISGFYNSPTIYQGSFKAKSIWNVDAGLQKQILKGKGTVKASFSDVFNSLRFRGNTEYAGQVAKFTQKGETQMFKLNFVYRFGSNQVKAARQRNSGSEEENKRVQQSGGIGQQ